MPKVNVLNMSGAVVEELELNDNVFGIEINEHVVYETVKNQLANKRQGTQSTKTRAEVRGGGKKPYRQKGTGRARQGSRRSPQFTGGGVVFAPKPRDYSYTLPKKVKRLAMKSVLSGKVVDSELIVLDQLTMEDYSTKKAVEILSNIKAEKKALIIVNDNNDKVKKSFANIPFVATLPVGEINVYDILKYDSLVLTKDVVKRIEEVYA
ncbi:50S ribosomal protein L4 [Peptostreptococcaceae bacterium oral taxon 113 str. W5053]|nr:50S ribosomal protein L4 [Peptostreptococcaceae bacterium oral taxon 113 str. W5053]